MNKAMLAIIKKDLRSITANKLLITTILSVPLALTVIIPTAFVLIIHFMPEQSGDFQKLLALIPQVEQSEDLGLTLVKAVLNYIMPVFFLIIPIMTASVMAASSFVGEKEKHTLETLLYSPLSLDQIFRAKILASFSLSMLVSLISFCAMLLALEIEVFFTANSLVAPNFSWLIVLLLLSPAIALIAITIIVRGSAKAQTVEEAQQGAVFLLLPILLLLVGQFTGLLLVSAWLLLGLAVAAALLALVLLKNAMHRFSYEKLLR